MSRKIIFLLGCALCLLISEAEAQWQSSGSDIYYNSGKVGIGTSSPGPTFQVIGATRQHTMQISHPTTNAMRWKLYYENSGVPNWGLQLRDDSDDLRMWIGRSSNNKNIAIAPTGGGVGIGEISPQSKLHVQNDDTGIATNYSDVIIEDVDAHLDIISNSDASWGSAINFVEGNGASNTDIWSIAKQTTNGNGDSSLRFNFGTNNSHSNPNKLTLLISGNIGIGTTAPEEKLTVAGTVKSREVIVEEDTGADFVFKEGYNLPGLEELEAFIKANKHLPEIPPAEEMIRDGVKVGDLQMKLLQKIEELTLYTLEQQKKIEALEQQHSGKGDICQ
ncbi:MAG: hypothetical protein WD604_05415 [Balneolaceae bacterium]